MLVAPQETLFENYPKQATNNDTRRLIEWCILNGNYSNTYLYDQCPEGIDKPFQNFVRHIRNAVSHMAFKKPGPNVKSFFLPEGGEEITHIYFKDSSSRSPCHKCKSEFAQCEMSEKTKKRLEQNFEITIPVSVLRELVFRISHEIIKVVDTL